MKEVLNVILVKMHLWLVNRCILPEGIEAEEICYAFSMNPDTVDSQTLFEASGMEDELTIDDYVSLAQEDLIRKEEELEADVSFEEIQQIAYNWCQGSEEYFQWILDYLLGSVAYDGEEGYDL